MKAKKIKIKIDNKVISCEDGESIMKAARRADIKIPGFCAHPDFHAKGNCRVCVVEIKGVKDLKTSCSTLAENGMEIKTDSPRVKKARNLNIELLFAEHIEKCATCVWRYECRLLSFAEKYKILATRFPDRKRNRQTYKFANSVEIDGTQCIDCRNCLDACSLMQNINYLELTGKGSSQEITPTKNKKIHCILCGQCAVHCPVSAAQEQSHYQAVENELKSKKNIMVAQFAPSVRVSVGECFGMPYGKIVAGKIVSGLKSLGFDYVFDVNFGADITTMVEAQELIERLASKNKQIPMITSCCPGWVNYVEFYHPELIPHLTSSRSPHIHSGGIIKTFWASKMELHAKDITVVSVMPCTAKKYEATRPELKISGYSPVDYVLTTREFAYLLKKNNIDFPRLKNMRANSYLGEYSGAAAIYGGSGGVMESALRTAQNLICRQEKNKACDLRIDFKDVRGFSGLKEASVKIGQKTIRIAVVNGIANVEPVIKNLAKYDYIEVMACPGGCIGGGGQPIPTTWEIRKKRVEALYKLDKSMKMRKAHENKDAQEVLGWLEKQGEKLAKSVLHTNYKKKSKY